MHQKYDLSRIHTEISVLWNTCGTSKSKVWQTDRQTDMRQTERQLTKWSLCSALLCWHHKIGVFYAEGKIHVKRTFHMGINIVIFMVFPQWYKHWFILAQGNFLQIHAKYIISMFTTYFYICQYCQNLNSIGINKYLYYMQKLSEMWYLHTKIKFILEGAGLYYLLLITDVCMQILILWKRLVCLHWWWSWYNCEGITLSL